MNYKYFCHFSATKLQKMQIYFSQIQHSKWYILEINVLHNMSVEANEKTSGGVVSDLIWLASLLLINMYLCRLGDKYSHVCYNTVQCTLYCIQYSCYWGRTYKGICIHNRHPISRPYGRVIRCLLQGILTEKIDHVIMAPHCTKKVLSLMVHTIDLIYNIICFCLQNNYKDTPQFRLMCGMSL